MKPERKIKIAESFSNKYAETELDIDLSQKEFEFLDRGIFAGNMDEKWNIFIHNDSLFFARSWTDNCIYKADLETKRRGIKLNKLKVTRNTDEYKGTDLKSDTDLFKKLLQMYLDREDLYIDERVNLPLIKSTIEKYSAQNELRKSIGSQSIELNLRIYNSLIESSSDYVTVIGLEELTNNTKKYDSKYELLSLHISNKENPKDSTTFFFNQEGTELLGQITIDKKASR
ncbi:hypothetical protein [Winogradskyella jejuensis]|uniref:Uncharacterized protein n=1 Tax=Winogradskyella jejuensis TaxID=1089305 RepID=A0A1M5VWM5_9FLAO|nr:hypothetical protein [Winogradskyella jejuensis]SHH79404.1 hypothetical protein SAMN05444148_2835 [Winogradskyella jejuensis]